MKTREELQNAYIQAVSAVGEMKYRIQKLEADIEQKYIDIDNLQVDSLKLAKQEAKDAADAKAAADIAADAAEISDAQPSA